MEKNGDEVVRRNLSYRLANYVRIALVVLTDTEDVYSDRLKYCFS